MGRTIFEIMKKNILNTFSQVRGENASGSYTYGINCNFRNLEVK